MLPLIYDAQCASTLLTSFSFKTSIFPTVFNGWRLLLPRLKFKYQTFTQKQIPDEDCQVRGKYSSDTAVGSLIRILKVNKRIKRSFPFSKANDSGYNLVWFPGFPGNDLNTLHFDQLFIGKTKPRVMLWLSNLGQMNSSTDFFLLTESRLWSQGSDEICWLCRCVIHVVNYHEIFVEYNT